MCTFLTEPEIPVGPTDNRKKCPQDSELLQT